ncbi:MAG TPA: hypothetical protein VNV44_09865 [Solirubrobacteraceae bacterium]|nr:hypothetical protein [Solirubrobacteraceae bacterium]
MNDSLGEARIEMGRLRGVLEQLGLKYVALTDQPLGLGIGLQWANEGDADRIVVVSIPESSRETVYLTSGVMKDVRQDVRNAVLEVCNRWVSQRPFFPAFLQEIPELPGDHGIMGERGLAVLIKVSLPVEAFVQMPRFFNAVLPGVPLAAEKLRIELSTQAEPQGRPYQWKDLDRLLARSFLST